MEFLGRFIDIALHLGHPFADSPRARDPFHLVFLAMVLISVMTVATESWRSRRTGALKE